MSRLIPIAGSLPTGSVIPPQWLQTGASSSSVWLDAVLNLDRLDDANNAEGENLAGDQEDSEVNPHLLSSADGLSSKLTAFRLMKG